jgi:FkbM family methyltransferase
LRGHLKKPARYRSVATGAKRPIVPAFALLASFDVQIREQSMFSQLKRKFGRAAAGAILAEQPPVRLKQCRHGLFMYNALDQYVGRSLDVYGELCEFETILFRSIVKPGMVAIDVGANIGAHTVSLAKFVAPAGSVIAIEPQIVVFQMLCGNVAINNLNNVTTLWSAAGEKSGSIKVPQLDYNVEGNFGGLSLESQRSGYSVPVLVLDSLQVQRCDFIKIDVEGMERDVLKGAKKLLQKFKPILYVENDRVDKSEALIRHLLDLDYRLYWDIPPLFNPDNYFGEKKNVFVDDGKPTSSFNMLCIHKTTNFPMPAGSVEIAAHDADKHPLKS